MSRFVGSIVYPTVSALPAGIAGQHVMYQGTPWYFDGTTWMRIGGGAVTYGRTAINVGAIPQPEVMINVVDANATITSSVQGWVAAVTPAGKDADEVEMDVINVWARPKAGSIDFRLTGQTGFIADSFFIDYLILKAA